MADRSTSQAFGVRFTSLYCCKAWVWPVLAAPTENRETQDWDPINNSAFNGSFQWTWTQDFPRHNTLSEKKSPPPTGITNSLHYHDTPLALLSRSGFFHYLPTAGAYIFTEWGQSAGFASFNVREAPVSVIIPGRLVPLSASPGLLLLANTHTSTPVHCSAVWEIACLHVSVRHWTQSCCCWPLTRRVFSHPVNQHQRWDTRTVATVIHFTSAFCPACCPSRASVFLLKLLFRHSVHLKMLLEENIYDLQTLRKSALDKSRWLSAKQKMGNVTDDTPLKAHICVSD